MKKKRELGEWSTDRLISRMSFSLSSPLIPALLLIKNLEGKEMESGVVEGGNGQIEVLEK